MNACVRHQRLEEDRGYENQSTSECPNHDVSDAADEDPVAQYQMITRELEIYGGDITAKHHAVIATKIDAVTDNKRLDLLKDYCKTNRIDYLAISAATNSGIRELIRYLADILSKVTDEADCH